MRIAERGFGNDLVVHRKSRPRNKKRSWGQVWKIYFRLHLKVEITDQAPTVRGPNFSHSTVPREIIRGHLGQTREMKYFVCAYRLTGQSFSFFGSDPTDATSKVESYCAMERSEVGERITELRRLLVS